MAARVALGVFVSVACVWVINGCGPHSHSTRLAAELREDWEKTETVFAPEHPVDTCGADEGDVSAAASALVCGLERNCSDERTGGDGWCGPMPDDSAELDETMLSSALALQRLWDALVEEAHTLDQWLAENEARNTGEGLSRTHTVPIIYSLYTPYCPPGRLSRLAEEIREDMEITRESLAIMCSVDERSAHENGVSAATDAPVCGLERNYSAEIDECLDGHGIWCDSRIYTLSELYEAYLKQEQHAPYILDWKIKSHFELDSEEKYYENPPSDTHTSVSKNDEDHIIYTRRSLTETLGKTCRVLAHMLRYNVEAMLVIVALWIEYLVAGAPAVL
jgi:hypothetical protein